MKRRKRINPISEKRRAYEDELAATLPALIARSHNICERCHSATASEPHHKLRRSQGGTNDLSNLVALCFTCHGWVHAHPEESYAQGYLHKRTYRGTFVVE